MAPEQLENIRKNNLCSGIGAIPVVEGNGTEQPMCNAAPQQFRSLPVISVVNRRQQHNAHRYFIIIGNQFSLLWI